MSRKGHYNGGGTIIRPWDSSWFGKKVPKWAKRKQRDSAPKPPLSLAEKAALEAFKQERESGSRLIRKGENQASKKRPRKAKAAKPKPEVVKPGLSRPQKDVAVITQALRHGKSRTIAVEFAADRKSKDRPGGRPSK